MNRLHLCLIVATAFVPSTLADVPKSKAAIVFEETWLKRQAELCKRVGGVLLTSTARLDGENLRIDWTLDYDGPRPPLIMLKPMYPENSFGATYVRIIIPDSKRTLPTGMTPVSVLLNQYGSRRPNKSDVRAARDADITVKKGESATGTIAVPLTAVKGKLVEKKTLLDPEQLPLEVYVGLVHGPQLRGGEFGLDAWTYSGNGDGLYSRPQRVVIKKW